MLDQYSRDLVKVFYEEHGYFIFRNIIPLKLIEDSIVEIESALKCQWDLYFCEDEFPGKDIAIVKLFDRNPHYRRMLYEWLNKRMLAPYNFATLNVVKEINKWIGIDNPMFQMAANRFHIPGENDFKTGSHQDIGIMTTESSISFWLPLVPSLRSNGSVKVWDKSHVEDVIVPEGPDYRGHSWIPQSILEKYEEIWEEYYPGDLLIFNTKLIHTSTSNNSNNCRWATIFRFDNADDNHFFDLEENPLHEGYIMVPDKKEKSGFQSAELKKMSNR